jgi:hypothetical protein
MVTSGRYFQNLVDWLIKKFNINEYEYEILITLSRRGSICQSVAEIKFPIMDAWVCKSEIYF